MKLPSSRDHSGRHQSNLSERRMQNLPPPVIIYIIFLFDRSICFLFFCFIIFNELLLMLLNSHCQIHRVQDHRPLFIEITIKIVLMI